MATATLQSQNLTDYLPLSKHHDTLIATDESIAFKTNEALPGFPSRYIGERVWTGSDIALKQDEWILTLDEADKVHILKALRYFQGIPRHSYSNARNNLTSNRFKCSS